MEKTFSFSFRAMTLNKSIYGLRAAAYSLYVLLLFGILSQSVFSITKIVSLTILLLALDWKEHYQYIKRHRIVWFAMGFYLIIVLGMAWGNVSWHDRALSLKIYLPLLFIPILMGLFKHKQWNSGVVKALILGCTLVSMLGALNWITGLFYQLMPNHSINRIEYPFGTLDFAMILAVFFALFRAYDKKRFNPFYSINFIWLSFFILFINQERTVIVLYLLITTLFIFLHFNKKARWMLIIALALFSFLAFKTSPTMHNRVLDTMSAIQKYAKGDPRTSMGLRLHFIEKSYQLWKEAPLIGHGTGSFPSQYFKLQTYGPDGLPISNQNRLDQPHNDIAFLAVQLGLLGIVVYLIFLSLLFARTKSFSRARKIEGRVFIFIVLVAGLPITLFFYSLNTYLLAIFIALLFYDESDVSSHQN